VSTGTSTIVVVEDDANIAELLDMYLRAENYHVVRADDGEHALQLVRSTEPALVLLDIGLRGPMDGLEVCRRLRADPSSSLLPIIMLTARDGEIDRVVGLELGADDYVTKPFLPREVVARVRALLRRSTSAAPTADVARWGAVELDRSRREARVDAKVVALTTREYDLLDFLARNSGQALSRRQLLDGVWGVDWYGDDRTVDVHVAQLRRKLGPSLPLETVRGYGYRLG
jgi:DNA-binding response OmpR family regulator